METTHFASRGMVVTPHHLASQSAVAILRQGGTAMEAIVAAAATLSVVYPQMNSIGGDGFWTIVPPIGDPLVIEACGAAGSLATPNFFTGYDKIPSKGPKSAITVAGTIGGWIEALKYVSDCGYQRISISILLADAIYYAENGFPISESLASTLREYKATGNHSVDFGRIFFPDGQLLKAGDKLYQKELAKTLRHLAVNGLDSFYRGPLAKSIADDMKSLGMPITESDLANNFPTVKMPLRLLHSQGELFNTPPPTQGVVSLAILGILDKLHIDGKNEADFIHAVVEATKQGFKLRDDYITDPRFMTVDAQTLLADREISKMANRINLKHVSRDEKGEGAGDTVWLGAIDDKGFAVSFIQSIYYEFGSGVLLPKTGINWHNRGVAFNLKKCHIREVKPGKKPFHTLNPAAARLNDGRTMIYGTRGGDGQPQTQAAVFHRYVIQGYNLQKAISSPRWLYGSNEGNDKDTSLKLEKRFSNEVVSSLTEKGYNIEMWPEYSPRMGQAGALVKHSDGTLEGAFDPRSDGSAVGY